MLTVVKGKKTIITRACVDCRESIGFVVPTAGLVAWQTGTLIQVAMPDVSAADREMLKTGICGVCWDKMFADDDDDVMLDDCNDCGTPLSEGDEGWYVDMCPDCYQDAGEAL